MIAALIQSRLDSKRLPNKAILSLGSKKLIEHCIDGVKRSKYFTPILITSDRLVDDPLEKVARENNILYYRGSCKNVALRVLNSIKEFNISYFARVNGDSPFLIPSLLDRGAENIFNSKNDFVSNIVTRTFPYGVSVEIFNAKTFNNVYSKLNTDPIYQEHYTKYFYDNIKSFNYYEIRNDINMSAVRAVVDTEDDLIYTRTLIEQYPDIFNKEQRDILKILNLQ
jgi:spore coat polysaccharide biosynthesis protein SpsF